MALLSADPLSAARFVESELGVLAAPTDAIARLRETLRVYFEENASPSRTARRLNVNKNTVVYRVRQGRELLGHDLVDRRPELEGRSAPRRRGRRPPGSRGSVRAGRGGRWLERPNGTALAGLTDQAGQRGPPTYVSSHHQIPTGRKRSDEHTTEQDLSSIDLSDPSLWDDGPPYDLFARFAARSARALQPSGCRADEGGFWSITRTRTSGPSRATSRPSPPSGAGSSSSMTSACLGRSAVADDLDGSAASRPPQGARHQGIHPRPRRGARGTHHQIVTSVLDSVAIANASTSSPTWLARSPPRDRVDARHAGRGRREARALDNVFTAFEDPAIREQWTDTEAVFTEIIAYVNELVEQRRKAPTEDLLTALMNAEVDARDSMTSRSRSSSFCSCRGQRLDARHLQRDECSR